MKKIALIAMSSALSVSAMAADLSTDDAKITYVIGTQMAESLKLGGVNEAVKLDESVLLEGITDVLSDKDLQMKTAEMDKVMQVFSEKMMKIAEKQAAEAKLKMAKLAEANKAEAVKLLADNKAKDGVKVTESGLQYRVITEGKGKKPVKEDMVEVHYKGTMASGEQFDSSYDRGEPAVFPLNAVIDGWVEGLQLMSEGSKFEFVIPAELAYGEMGPGAIGPNRALIFEVELLKINPKAKTEGKDEKKPEAKEEKKSEAKDEKKSEVKEEKKEEPKKAEAKEEKKS